MADKRFSEFDVVTTMEDTDIFALSRAGVSKQISGAAINLGNAIVRGPLSFTYATPNLDTGVEFYTPTVGEVLLDAFFIVDVGFTGGSNQALATIGTFVGRDDGFWSGGYFTNFNLVGGSYEYGGYKVDLNYGNYSLASNGENYDYYANSAPGVFTDTYPLKLVVSTNGYKNPTGSAISSTVGAARLYIVTAFPQAF